ncbi:MAG: 16S rRNA (adenine(1518)-N(6)/adenine(1519)-N(6))-dimethyltransferase RsmA [Thermoprotei archaeon]|nr:16S rRNA (adenine(1518)-N(6)/adenine(1519)-N(6))-dimethyltransferase RsmA [Thermoprotei archaeon]
MTFTRRSLLEWTLENLERLGVKPRESLGQHFLVDPRGLEFFLEPLSRAPYSDMMEVGPGLGALTLHAAGLASRIVAVEVDRSLAEHLSGVAPENVAVVVGDGVDHSRSTSLKVLYSNTPYSLSSVILRAVAENNNIAYAVLGVQRELASRMIAEPGSPDYGRLTLLVERYFKARIVGVIPRSYYYPQPEVHGAVVELSRIREWREGDDAFEELSRCLFSGRNKKASKMASKCLGVEGGLEWLKEKRVKELTVEDLERLLEFYK